MIVDDWSVTMTGVGSWETEVRGRPALGVTLTPLRPYLTAVALLLLAGAFYELYRPRWRRPGQACPVRRGPRGTRVGLWTIAFFTLGMLTVELWSSWAIYWLSTGW